MLSMILGSFAPMSSHVVRGVCQARRNGSESFLSIRRAASEGLQECRCPAGAHAERRSIDERTSAERSELMAVMVLDDTAAGRGFRSPYDAPSGVTIRLCHVARQSFGTDL